MSDIAFASPAGIRCPHCGRQAGEGISVSEPRRTNQASLRRAVLDCQCGARLPLYFRASPDVPPRPPISAALGGVQVA